MSRFADQLIVQTKNTVPTQALYISGTVRIMQQDQGIALFAASHGLNAVFLDLNGLQVMQGNAQGSFACDWEILKTRRCLPQIKIPDWMRGNTCGMCGNADGDYLQEYRTPNGRLATSSLSFTQSWVIPGTGCRDISSNTF